MARRTNYGFEKRQRELKKKKKKEEKAEQKRLKTEAATLKTLHAPDDWYEWRASEGGGEVRDVVPYEGAVRYVTDGKQWGVEYDDGTIDMLGPIDEAEEQANA